MSKYCSCILSNKIEVSYRGNVKAPIVFVAESPGEEEEKQRKMLVGPSGKLLAQSLREVGFDLSNIFLMNAVRCRIDKRVLSSKEINQILDCCRPKFAKILKVISPKLIVCLGELAFKQVMNIKKGIAVSSIAGKEFYSDEFNCKVVATYHPAHILRNPHKRTFFLSDLKFAHSLLHTSANSRKALVWKEVDSIAPILNGDLFKNGKCYFTALDSETQGLKWYDSNSIIISYSIAKDLYEGWNVVLHEEVDNLNEADFYIEVIRDGKKQKIGIKKAPNYEQKVEELRELLARKDIKKYFMNLKYEKHRFYNLGIRKFESCFDVKVMAHCLDPDAYKNSSLRELASVFLDNSFHLYKDLLKDEEKEDMLLTLKKNRSDFNKYACADAVITLQLGMVLRKLLAKDKKLSVYYSLLAQPVESEVLFEIERNGVLVDKDKIPALKKRIQLEMANVTDEFIKKCPKKVVEKHKDDFKLSKGIILREALFKWEDRNGKHELGFNLEPILVSRKTGEPIIDKKKVLLKILHGNYPDKVKDLVQTYLKWRELEKLLTNYIKNIEQQLTKENRLHPDVSITFTATGRTGMRKPALQTIPKRSETAKYIRELFVAPKGKVLLEVDYNISELRWIAHVANERTLKKFFQEDKDPHLQTGLWVKGIKDPSGLDKKVLKQIRQEAKPIGFGLSYGMSPKGLQNYALTGFGVKFTEEESKKYWREFFKLYKDLPAWHKRTKEFARKYGYVRTVFGRIRKLPHIYSNNVFEREEAERQALNTVIQSPSSDGTLLGAYEILHDPRVKKEECKLVLFIHDALIFEIDEDKLEYYYKIIKEHMENLPTERFGFKLSVPLKIEGEYGYSLAEMKEIE